MKKITKYTFITINTAILILLVKTCLAFDGLSTPGFNTLIPNKIMTPDTVSSRIGDLKFIDGLPTKDTATKVFNNLDFIRGVDVFLNFIPATSMESIRIGFKSVGADSSNDVVIFENLMDSNSLFLTGNTDTVYAAAILDLEKDGVTVVEIPAGAGPGTLNDAFFRFVTDMGAPGPDRKKGGTYIILPPNYIGDLVPTGTTFRDVSTKEVVIAGKKVNAWISQSRSYTNWLILRGFLVDGKPNSAADMWKKGLKIYPLKEAKAPKTMNFINGSGRSFNTVHSNNYSFYEELWQVLQKEPVDFIDPELRGQASAIGIQKGKAFNPDTRMIKILADAVAVGNATARSIAFRPRNKDAYIFSDRQWYTGFVGGDYRWLNGDGLSGRNLDARTLFFYLATVNTPAMALKIPGIGANYALSSADKHGEILKGKYSYKLNIPANVPAKNFWSVVIYDPQTRSELQTDQPYPSKNNKRDNLIYNKDGSVDLYFGPTAPKGKESNWTQTVPGKSWFSILRLYGPLQPWFDKSWSPGDFERINE